MFQVGQPAPTPAPRCLKVRSTGCDPNSMAALPQHALDQQFARWIMLHVQFNPLPICTRPRVLIKGKRT